MKPLRLDKAVELYKILRSHIPDVADDETAIEFIGKIIDNARQSSTPGDYVDALILMSGRSLMELNEMGSEQRLELFIEGLSENKIVKLKTFCDVMGFNHG